jgi:hypothetical protein
MMPNAEQSVSVVSQQWPLTQTFPSPHWPVEPQGSPGVYWVQNPLVHAWPEGQSK